MPMLAGVPLLLLLFQTHFPILPALPVNGMQPDSGLLVLNNHACHEVKPIIAWGCRQKHGRTTPASRTPRINVFVTYAHASPTSGPYNCKASRADDQDNSNRHDTANYHDLQRGLCS